MTILFSVPLILLLAMGDGHTQPSVTDCSRRATAPRDLEVLDQPPTYSTTSGWTYGQKRGTLPRGTPIRICEERFVGFFFSKQRWLRIQWDASGGWIDGADVESHLYRRLHALLISTAYAQSPSAPARLLDPLTVGSFIAMILGMVGKTIFDLFSGTSGSASWSRFTIRFVPSLVISPIVFLGIVRNVPLLPHDPGDQAMLVLFLFAFQNGFFWQDVVQGIGAAFGARPA